MACLSEQQLSQQFFLLRFFYPVDGLADNLHNTGCRSYFHTRRIVQQTLGKTVDTIGHGGREEKGLLLGRELGQEAFDVMDKSHVEHTVGLIKNKVANIVEADKALRHQVEQTSGSSRQDVRPGTKFIGLRLLFHSAEDNRVAQGRIACIVRQRFINLNRQLPGWSQDKRTDATRGTFALGHRGGKQLLDDGYGESGGFAGSGLRQSQQITAGQGFGYSLFLDKCGGRIVFFEERTAHRLRNIHLFKCHHFFLLRHKGTILQGIITIFA